MTDLVGLGLALVGSRCSIVVGVHFGLWIKRGRG
jgi:hypothetical protein